MSLLQEMEKFGLADCEFNNRQFESDITDDVYDYLFENKTHVSFVEEFPESYIDCANATIYLARKEGEPLFKIKIERV